MKHTKHIYFISMWIITLVLAILFLSAAIISLIIFVFPILPVINKMQNGAMLVLTIILSSLVVSLLIFLLFKASKLFQQARYLNDSELVEQRQELFGYGIFSAILFFPTILGLIIMLVFVIFINDYLLEKEKVTKNVEIVKKEVIQKENTKIDDNIKILLMQLDALEDLKKQGLCTEEEYNEKRKKILGL